MNDVKQIIEIIEERKKRYIGLTEDISWELLNILVETPRQITVTLFEKGAHSHLIHVKCSKCLCEDAFLLTTDIQKYIQSMRKDKKVVLCNKCQSTFNVDIKKDAVYNNTMNYISKFLKTNSNYEWNAYDDPVNKWNEINVNTPKSKSSLNPVNMDEISRYINGMDYLDFLNTSYWKTVAQRVKYAGKFKCSKCGSENKLVAHHKSYKNHGREHLYWYKDLICICNKCHKKAY